MVGAYGWDCMERTRQSTSQHCQLSAGICICIQDLASALLVGQLLTLSRLVMLVDTIFEYLKC